MKQYLQILYLIIPIIYIIHIIQKITKAKVFDFKIGKQRNLRNLFSKKI